MDLLIVVRNVIRKREEVRFELEAKLMDCFTHFEFVDLIGFAKMMEVDPAIIKKVLLSTAAEGQSNNADWEDLICSTVEAFSKKTRQDRRRFLKLARDIQKNNDEFNRAENQNDSPSK